MLIKGVLPVIRSKRQKRGFAFSYTTLQESNVVRIAPEGGHARMRGMNSTTNVVDLAGRPWPARKRRINQRIPGGRLYALLGALLLGGFLWAAPLSALEAGADDNNRALLQQQIEAFNHSEGRQFAPQTIKRAEAYIGAAMLALEQQQRQQADQAMSKAAETLAEARQTAADFRQRFADLLRLRRSATAIGGIIASSGKAVSDLAPTQLIDDAERELALAISTHEQGKLNQTNEHAGNAANNYRQALDKTLPWLTELTASAIAKAANTRGKQYAPQIYQAAKDKLAELEAFLQGKSDHMPEHPEEGLYLARESRHVAEQVKAWRKKRGSHEALLLKSRVLKLKLANALEISNATNPMLTDIDGRDLIRAVAQLKLALADEREAHRRDMARLASEYRQQLQHKLASRTDELKQQQQQQLASIKEAFRAKLERETFEKKRQEQLRKLFKPGEVEILVNLDGSLLIRLKALKFASGSSKIAPKYFDMLGRMKQAMELYQDRRLRIEGHTDNLGEVRANQVLSLKRAEAVRDFLISAGVDGTRLKALGYGEVHPIASNEFKQGRAMNRRIDVVIEAPDSASHGNTK